MRAKKLTKFVISVVCAITMVAGNITEICAEEYSYVEDNYHDKFNELYNSMIAAVQNHDVNTLRSIYEPGTSEEELSSMANQEVDIEGFEQYPTTYVESYKKNGAVYMTGYYKVDNKCQADYSYTYTYSAYYMKRINGNFYLANSANSQEATKKAFCKNISHADYTSGPTDDTNLFYSLKMDYTGKNTNNNKIWIGNHQPSYESQYVNGYHTTDYDSGYYNYDEHYSYDDYFEPYFGALHIEPVILWQVDICDAVMYLCFENGFNSTTMGDKDVRFTNITVTFSKPNGKTVITQSVQCPDYVEYGDEKQLPYHINLGRKAYNMDSWDNLQCHIDFDYETRDHVQGDNL